MEASAESVAAWSVDLLAHDIEKFGSQQQWLWCLSAIALMQELILCAEGGAIDPAGFATDRDVEVASEPLRALRSALFHPALQRDANGKPAAMRRLIEFMKNDDNPEIVAYADDVSKDWSRLGTTPIGRYALRKLDAAVRALAFKLDLSGESETGHPPRKRDRRRHGTKRHGKTR